MGRETEYLKNILKTGELDTSDCILVGLKILKTEKLSLADQQSINEAIASISVDYLKGDYPGAIKKLISVAGTLEDSTIKKLLEEAFVKAIKNDNPERLESRRYFETRYSTAQWKTLDTVAHHESMEHLAKFMVHANKEYSATKSYSTLKNVTNLAEMETVIASMKGFAEATSEIVQTHNTIRDQANTLSARKDRGAQRKIEDVGGTRSPGIVKANTPVPQDELRDKAVYGSIADSFLIKRGVKEGYSQSMVEVPYVNSVSGTAYYLSALLVKYIEQNRDSPTLQQDVDNIVNTFVSYASRTGFHSLSEMVDVFQSWEITSALDQYDVKLHFPVDQHLLDTVISSASDYVATRHAQKQLVAEISKVRTGEGSMQSSADDLSVDDSEQKEADSSFVKRG